MSSIYIHIPFCDSLCSYCDFCKVLNYHKFVDSYLQKLDEEITSDYDGRVIKTLYIGGGTPSALSVLEIKRLFEIIKKFNLTNDCEITFECNIENTTIEKLQLLYNLGVNRLSFGIQTFNQRLLNIINRKHDIISVNTVIDSAKNIGFKNINVDLIFNLPSQTIEELKADLQKFLLLDVTHISIYSLILEQQTLFYHQGVSVDDDLSAEMYKIVIKFLTTHDYTHYEISNFSKAGYQSEHNLVYWNCEEYYGFGLGAHGYVNNIRYANTSSITQYLKINKREYEEINEKERRSEYLLLGLRKTVGININEFNSKFNCDLFEIYDLNKELDDLLIIENGYLKFTTKGLLLANEVFVKFISD